MTVPVDRSARTTVRADYTVSAYASTYALFYYTNFITKLMKKQRKRVFCSKSVLLLNCKILIFRYTIKTNARLFTMSRQQCLIRFIVQRIIQIKCTKGYETSKFFDSSMIYSDTRFYSNFIEVWR